jgi:mannose/fructose/N-acetylgalactosamine-specific phosphotransferase system component IID
MEHCRGALNTNPFSAGAVVGTIARAEDVAQEISSIDRIASVAQSTLAAGGDRFFWQTLRPALTALGVVLGLMHSPFAPLGFLLAFNFVTQGTRALGLRLGYEQGRAAIPTLQDRYDRWTRSLVPFAAVVTGLIFFLGLFGRRLAEAPGMKVAAAGLGHLSTTIGRVPVRISWLLIPLAILSWLGLRLRISQTYLLLIFLLIFAGAKLIL